MRKKLISLSAIIIIALLIGLNVNPMNQSVYLIGKAKAQDYPLYFELIKTFATEANVRAMIRVSDSNVLVGTEEHSQIWKTTDDGDSWTKVLDLTGTASDVNMFAIVNTSWIYSAHTGYLGSGPAYIYKSTDGGDSWTELFESPYADARFYSIEYLGNGILLAGTSPTCRIYKSTDYGETWDIVETFGERYVLDILHLGDGKVIMTIGHHPDSGTGKIYRSTDYGDTWTLVYTATGEHRCGIFSIIGDTILTPTQMSGQILKSVNNGSSWTILTTITGPASSLPKYFVEYEGVWYASFHGIDYNYAAVWRSFDNGASWAEWDILEKDTEEVMGGAGPLIFADVANEIVFAGTAIRLVEGGAKVYRWYTGEAETQIDYISVSVESEWYNYTESGQTLKFTEDSVLNRFNITVLLNKDYADTEAEAESYTRVIFTIWKPDDSIYHNATLTTAVSIEELSESWRIVYQTTTFNQPLTGGTWTWQAKYQVLS